MICSIFNIGKKIVENLKLLIYAIRVRMRQKGFEKFQRRRLGCNPWETGEVRITAKASNGQPWARLSLPKNTTTEKKQISRFVWLSTEVTLKYCFGERHISLFSLSKSRRLDSRLCSRHKYGQQRSGGFDSMCPRAEHGF